MSNGFINITTSGSGDVSYYLREKECTGYYHSGGELLKKDILEAWERMEEQEKMGNKALGIRGRHDAQVRKNYTLSMPNELSPLACIERVREIVEQTPIKDCTYTIAVHRGLKEDVHNQHVHLLVNERNLATQKKDREMIKKSFLEQTFRPLYHSAFELEFSKGNTYEWRERIEVGLYESDRAYSRGVIEEANGIGLSVRAEQEESQSKEAAKEAKTLSFLQDLAAAMKSEKLAEQERQAQSERERAKQREQQKGRGMKPY